MKYKELRNQLTQLLGKKSWVEIASPCTGQYAARTNYGLRFDDGSEIFITNRRQACLDKLDKIVKEFSYFRDNYDYLMELTAKVIRRDNTMAMEKEMPMMELMEITLNKTSNTILYVGPIIKWKGKLYQYIDVDFSLAYLDPLFTTRVLSSEFRSILFDGIGEVNPRLKLLNTLDSTT